MKKLGVFLILIVPLLGFQACGNDDKVKEISKEGSIETSIKVDHLNDSLDILISTNKVWIHNALVKTTIHADTIPTLGISMEEAENDNGEIQNVFVKKDYELYITVK
jgi:hypothetical protein